MQIDTGIPYTVTVENITVPTNSGTPFDLVQLATSSAVPIVVQRIVATAGVTTSTIQRVSLLLRSTSGTGGTGVTARATNGGVAASTTVSYNVVSSVGTPGNIYDNQQWNEFAPYEFNQKPGGIYVPVSGFISLYLPATPVGTFPCSFTVEFVELK